MALTQQAETLLSQFDRIEDAYLCERKADVVQVIERVLKALTNSRAPFPPPLHPEEDSIRSRTTSRRPTSILFKQHRFAELHHRRRRLHVAHRDPGAQPQHPFDRRPARRRAS